MHLGILYFKDGEKQACMKWKWSRIKDSGNKPSHRSGFGATSIGGNRMAIFGGVYDEDEEEDIDSVFYNSLYCFDVISYRYVFCFLCAF